MKKGFFVYLFFSLLFISSFVYAESNSSTSEPVSTPSEETVKEQVKCVFANSGTEQKCHTDDGKFSCSGTEACIVDVYGSKGNKLLWKSSCEGDATTILSEENKYAEFKCSSIKIPIETAPVTAKEQVKCVFANSDSEQKCHTDDGKFSCSGVGACIVDVYGDKEKKLTWKSSCGSYAYTVIDGSNDYAEFKCQLIDIQKEIKPQKEVKVLPYGAKERVKCVFANSDTEQKCYTQNFKFNCYGIGACTAEVYGEMGENIVWKSSCDGQAITTVDGKEKIAEFKCNPLTKYEKESFINIPGGYKPLEPDLSTCKDSCPLDGKCYPFGYRKNGNFCSDMGSFVEQFKEELSCENNFECSSNFCINNQCARTGLIQKIMNFLRLIFQGSEDSSGEGDNAVPRSNQTCIPGESFCLNNHTVGIWGNLTCSVNRTAYCGMPSNVLCPSCVNTCINGACVSHTECRFNNNGTSGICVSVPGPGGNRCTPLNGACRVGQTYCGDGIKQSPNANGTGGPSNDGVEDCDINDLGGNTCQSLGFDGGNLRCGSSCAFDTSRCTQCGNGIIESNEECEGSNLGSFTTCQAIDRIYTGGSLSCYPPESPNECRIDISGCSLSRSNMRVFITSQLWNGNLGGVEGADQKCQASADAAGLNGTWKAWISTQSDFVLRRFYHSPVPYLRMDGQLISVNWVDLTSMGSTGSHNAPISIDERGVAHSENAGYAWVWTGTFRDGFAAGPFCNDWTSSTRDYNGSKGSYNLSDSGWTEWYDIPCDRKARLYCFEQI